MHRFTSYQRCLLLLIVTSLPVLTSATNNLIPDQNPFNPSLSKNCTTISYLHSNSTITGDIIIAPYSPLLNNEFPKIPILNTSSAGALVLRCRLTIRGLCDLVIFLPRLARSRFWAKEACAPNSKHSGLTDRLMSLKKIYAESSVMESCPKEFD